MSKLKVYKLKGKSAQEVMPSQMQTEINGHLLSQAIHVYRNRLHRGHSKTKTRSDVVASTAKIYRQKGTGRARHGAISAPLFVGGGKAHGAKFEKRILTLPKKMKRKALKMAINLKAKEDKVALLDGLSAIKKTKEARSLIDKIKKAEKNAKEKDKLLLCLSQKNNNVRLFFRNLPDVRIVNFKELNAYTLFYSNFILIDKEVYKKAKKTDSKKQIKKSKKNKK